MHLKSNNKKNYDKYINIIMFFYNYLLLSFFILNIYLIITNKIFILHYLINLT